MKACLGKRSRVFFQAVVFSFIAITRLEYARAEVVQIEIEQRVPFAEGHSFGRSGPYEKLSGRMLIEVNPDDAANRRIHDLKLAPRNERGRVECWTDFYLLKPLDPRRGNGRILYDVHNRGNKLAIWTFNGARGNDPTTLADAGNGFLMLRGYSILWTGWNGDVVEDGTSRLLVQLPVARVDGETITGKAHVEFCTSENMASRAFFWSPWGTSDAYPSVSDDNANATLTMRAQRSDAAVEVARDQWAFARWEDGRLIPDPTHLYVKNGFQPGWLYDLVYTAKAPRVTGLGLAALRDCVSFFRYAEQDALGTANPLHRCVQHAYIFGISQSGRLIHHFIFEGLNTDEASRAVFDGALIHVAGAGKGMFNYRFRMTTVYGTQHAGNLSGSEFFPFALAPQTDPATGRQGDTLARARAAGHVPKIVFTQTSTEYWTRAASLLHTDVEGKTDLTLPPNVRIYHVAGAQHLGTGPDTRGICQQPRNVLDDRPPVLRACLVVLDDWAGNGKEPPPSRYPRLVDKTLVDLPTFRESFPEVQGLRTPDRLYRPRRLDFGPRFETLGISDIIPPKMGAPYRTLVPQVDADGNEIAGIRLPDVAVPLGTYTGWNLRDAEYGAEGTLGLDGMYLPFALTKEDRDQRGDPRSSIRERYPSRDAYLAKVTVAALKLQSERLLLADDVVEMLRVAAKRRLWDGDPLKAAP